MNAEAALSHDEDSMLTMRPGAGPALGRIDQYELVRKLGGGGFGVVYLAWDTASGVEVALKTLHPLLKHSPEEMEALREKFAVVSRLSHPNVATALVLHPVREVSVTDEAVRQELRLSPGDAVMVMRYAPGVTLSKWRRQFSGGVVPFGLALEVGRQIASALDYAHSERIVHRDVKPANVMVETLEEAGRSGGTGTSGSAGTPRPTADGSPRIRVRLLDFGLAAEIRSSMSRISTEQGDTSGTRPYMAPEQWSGRRQDGRTDQYALACVIYELVAGEPPFAGAFETGDPIIMSMAVRNEAAEEVEGLSSAANAALLRALSKDPKDRFPTCAAFVAALSSVTEAAEEKAVPPCEPATPNPLSWTGACPPCEPATSNPLSWTRAYGERLAFALFLVGSVFVALMHPELVSGFLRYPHLEEGIEFWCCAPLVFCIPAFLTGMIRGREEERSIGFLLLFAALLYFGLFALYRANRIGYSLHGLDYLLLAEGTGTLLFAGSLCLHRGVRWMAGLTVFLSFGIFLFANGKHHAASSVFWIGPLLTAAGGVLLSVSAKTVRPERPHRKSSHTWKAGFGFLLLFFTIVFVLPVGLFPLREKARIADQRKERARLAQAAWEQEEARRLEEEELLRERRKEWQRLVEASSSRTSSLSAGETRRIPLSGTMTMAFRWCPAGSFRLQAPEGYQFDGYTVSFGADARSQDVLFAHGFWMGEREVTQGEWKAVMEDGGLLSLARMLPWRNASEHPETYCGNLEDDIPMYYVSFRDAKTFCSRLTEKERRAGRLPEGYAYRLPTSAEWEYACYAGVSRERGTLPDGSRLVVLGKNNAPALGRLAWYAGNATKEFKGIGWDMSGVSEAESPGERAAPRAVGTRWENAWGLKDMLGNVREWCGVERVVDMQPEDRRLGKPIIGADRSPWFPVRGGSWRMDVARCVPWAVTEVPDTYRSNELGFRVVLAPTMEE